MRNSHVAAYLRVSTDEQRERATIETQRVEVAKRVAEDSLDLIGTYADDGWSGRKLTLGQRPEGARLLADAKNMGIDTVIVYRADRLGRGRKLLSSVDELVEAGVRYVVSVTETTYDLKDPNHEFQLTMLSGVSGYETASFLQRSRDATNRLAREGTWLGGIVPYGYHVEGEGRHARLVVSEASNLGISLSEADVIRLIFQRTIKDRWTCQQIADELNQMRVPPAYVRDERTTLRGKRVRTVQGIWRPGRIRNMLVNQTYMGVHRYGKRSQDKDREIIERAVPAIVDNDTWEQAQVVLRSHMLLSSRNAKRPYLLRGLVKCKLCGLTYSGYTKFASDLRYYRCNGHAQARGLYGREGRKCPSKGVNADTLETAIWTDIEGFLRDPGDVLDELAAHLQGQTNRLDMLRDVVAEQRMRYGEKQAERDVVITLFRRGRIDAASLDRQLDIITEEEDDLRANITAREADLAEASRANEGLRDAAALLRELNAQLDAPLSFDVKRQIVETLVGVINVDTVLDEKTGDPRVNIFVTYRFSRRPGHQVPIASRTGSPGRSSMVVLYAPMPMSESIT